ncbi:energy-coupling factor transporter transmembrane component T family protein [Leuconostoc suionicum]|uniref:energy-coupling factor transporter transmembrane component T family protein n=1 Tax=Leuconostoc suionicum TaxID=1511761 RepID=UPI0021AAB573|nr:energy-coupling factor transporter transmembrane component T [Leuconostoc suionicum]MCT4382478.1 energy-coupling factor transporter transmembrane protein EcfT [Leuconostoc suionicum]MDC2806217.1 energy-coupling factor transporter transmembrane component T [Leuconostoc suionicum]MDC2823729.1 energy-coupling factor transporter transmembrane component T [Leuconostoc suionicum]
MDNSLFGYKARNTWINHATGTAKLIGFLALTTIGMISYDTRFLIALTILSFVLIKMAHIKYQEYALLLKLVLFIGLINLVMITVLAPQYGEQLYGTKHVMFGSGWFTITQEQLFYEFNLLLKYLFSFPLSIVLLFTTNPSEFAAGLNKIGVPYKVAYAVAITLRYIPDVQSDYRTISLAQQARGYEISKKSSLIQRMKGTVQIILPLVFSSLGRIDTISQAMELRRFGRYNKRSWYQEQRFSMRDVAMILWSALIVIIGVLLFITNGGRMWNPFK